MTILGRLTAVLSCVGILLTGVSALAAQTLGLLQSDPGSFNGYTLFHQIQYPELFLIDNDGQVVHSWTTPPVTGNTAYLMDNGHVIRCADPGGNTTFVAGGDGGLIQELDWDGTVLWEYLYSDTQVRHHHDIAPLPNGNVLLIAWEYRSGPQAIQAGRDPLTMQTGELWPEHIVEVEPAGTNMGNIVWEWHVWDHLVQDFDVTKDNFGVIADSPELIDINHRANDSADWMHANAIDYNADLDQILFSVPRFNEFWIIDHSTTTAEAVGHTGGARGMGGDLLYRWGNPAAYERGGPTDQMLFNQHGVHWIPNGLAGADNVLLFNNQEPTLASVVDEIETPVDGSGNYPALAPGAAHGPTATFWSYPGVPPSSLSSPGLSGAQRQPNGNTLICEGSAGNFIEIDALDEIVWRYINPMTGGGPLTQGANPVANAVFRAERYPVDFPGFAGRDLTPQGPIELACPSPGFFAPSTASLAADQDNYCEDWAGAMQPGDDLSRSNLELVDLSVSDLSSSLLVDTDLTDADLSGADLTGADVTGTILSGARYDESTIFPSGNSYDIPPWGLDGGISPWGAGMIFVPEPSLALLQLFAAATVIGLAAMRGRA